VLILGHSPGTTIAGLLSAELGREGVHPRGTVLVSVRLIFTVRFHSDCCSHFLNLSIFGCLPLFKPLSMIPLASSGLSLYQFWGTDLCIGVITWSMVHRFDTLTLVPVS